MLCALLLAHDFVLGAEMPGLDAGKVTRIEA